MTGIEWAKRHGFTERAGDPGWWETGEGGAAFGFDAGRVGSGVWHLGPGTPLHCFNHATREQAYREFQVAVYGEHVVTVWEQFPVARFAK